MENSIVNVKLSDHSYDIVIGSGLLQKSGEYISQVVTPGKICVVTDEEVSKYHLFKVTRSLIQAGFEITPPIVLPPGEFTKNFKDLQLVVNSALASGLNRNSTLVALGGGVIGDIAGFAASIIMRGINFIQIPTTLLAQVDSSVGGKTAINTNQGKNLVGTFCQPNLVLIDMDVLQTLPKRQLLAGYGEVVKYALINNPRFFEWLDKNCYKILGGNILGDDYDMLKYAVEVCCKTKAKIVKQDEKEDKDIRAILNFGHSFGHAIEAFSNYDNSCLHGEAVSIGMLLAFEFSHDLGICPKEDVQRVRWHFEKLGMMTNPPFRITAEDMLKYMKKDKKNDDNQMNLILTKGIGKAFLCKNVDEEEIKSFLLKNLG